MTVCSLVWRHEGCADVALTPKVLAGAERQVLGEVLEERVVRLELEHAQRLENPGAARLRQNEFEVGMPFERARPQQSRKGPVGPHVDLADVHRGRALDVAVVRRPAGMRVGRHAEFLADGPEGLVARVVVKGVLSRARGKQDAAPQTHLLGVADLLNSDVDVVDVHDRNPGVAPRVGIAQVGEPAVVGAVALQVLARIDRRPVLHQTGAEGGHLRKDDLACDPILLELREPDRRIPLAFLGCERIVLVIEHGAKGVVVELFRRIQYAVQSSGAFAGLFREALHRFLIEEGAHARHHLPHERQPPGIAGLVKLRRHVLLVGRGKPTRVTVGADDQYVRHGRDLHSRVPPMQRSA